MKISQAELIQRKERIIHTAFKLFCQNGIDKVTIKDIAKQASVGEKSIYRYFNTKKELLMETSFMLWQEIASELSVAMEREYEAKTGYAQLETLLQCFRSLFENHAEYVLFSYDYKLFLIRHAVSMTEREYDEILHPIHMLYLNALHKGKADGSIAFREKEEDMYFALWGLMRGYVVKIVIYDRMYEGENPWKNRFDIACGLILRGLKSC